MTIVFGTTLRSDDEPSADVAGLLATKRAEALRLVHVSQDLRAPVVLGTDEEHILGPLRTELEREAQRIAARTGAHVQAHLAAGAVHEALASVSEWELASALVVGAGTDASKGPLGSIAERVARSSRVPVLALREPRVLARWLAGSCTLRVLVGADLGRAASAARAFAASLTKDGPCEIAVVNVASPQRTHARLGLPPPVDEHALSPEALVVLERELAERAPTNERARLRVLAGRGSADAHLSALADREEFDLVVVGQRRRSLVEQLWYGSVGRGVLHSAPTNVACVPLPPNEIQPSTDAPREVVVATDLTPTSDAALALALGLVAPGGSVHLAHVTPPSDGSRPARELRERAADQLGKLALARRSERANIETHLLEGEPAPELLALSARAGAGLIVLGVRPRPALSRAVLGSVALALLEANRVPVLMVPERGA